MLFYQKMKEKNKPENKYIFLKFHRLSDRVVNKKELRVGRDL